MATTASGSPYVLGTDNITTYPTTSLALANRVDSVASTAASDLASSVSTINSALALKSDILSEPMTDGTITTNVLTFDLSLGNVVFIATAPSAAFTVNFTNAATTNGRSTSASVIVTQGATGYIPNVVQVAGSAVTIKWQGGTAPTPTSSAGKFDVFSFSLLRRSSTWTAFGSSLANF